MASRNRSISDNQGTPTRRVLRSALRDDSNSSLTEIDTSYLNKSVTQNMTRLNDSPISLPQRSPRTKAKSVIPKMSLKSSTETRIAKSKESSRAIKSLLDDSYSSDDIDTSIIDPSLLLKKGKRTSTCRPKPKITLTPKPSRSREPEPRRTVSFMPTVISDSDFEEDKRTIVREAGSSRNTPNKAYLEPKVLLEKLDLRGLINEVTKHSNRKLESSSSSSFSDFTEDDDETSSEDESSCEDRSNLEEDRRASSNQIQKLCSRNSHVTSNTEISSARNWGLQMENSNEYEPYNHEAYFLANTRMKFQKENASPPPQVPNDCRKGVARKPRKGTRGLGGTTLSVLRSLPVCPIDPSFSVSKEAARAVSNLISQQGNQADTDDSEEEPADLQAKNDHSKEIQNLMKYSIESQFPSWIMLMSEGFNVIIHGFGSKIPVFNRFKSFLDEEYLVIRINGLYSKLNARSFLVNLCDALELEDPIKVSGTNLELAADHVISELKTLDDHPDVFLFLMHLDHIATNHPILLNVLCTLAKLKWIHILASCDKVNASLGLTQTHASTFNFCWFPCSTFLPYRQELTWNPSVFGDQASSSGGEGKQTLQYVLKSLTTNARKAFTILASMQLAHFLKLPSDPPETSNEDSADGVDFSALLRRCRESFIAHSDAALKALLVEFIDHKLIDHGKTKAIGNRLRITLDRETLQEIANDKL